MFDRVISRLKGCLAPAALVGSTAAGMLVTVPAHAALPTGVAGVFTGLSSDFGDLVDLAWPVFLVIVGGLVLFGLVKKVVYKTI